MSSLNVSAVFTLIKQMARVNTSSSSSLFLVVLFLLCSLVMWILTRIIIQARMYLRMYFRANTLTWKAVICCVYLSSLCKCILCSVVVPCNIEISVVQFWVYANDYGITVICTQKYLSTKWVYKNLVLESVQNEFIYLEYLPIMCAKWAYKNFVSKG